MARTVVGVLSLLTAPAAAWLALELVPPGLGAGAAWVYTVVCGGTAVLCLRIGWMWMTEPDPG